MAYHEAGHAIVATALPNCDPVHKVTIVPRGMAGGYVLALPDAERTLMSRAKMVDDLAFARGGRAAEEVGFEDITSGAQNDLARVPQIARQLVTRLGMSKVLGPRVYGKKEEMVFLGREISEQRDYSETVAKQIDDEVLILVSDALVQAKKIIKKYRKTVDTVAAKLMEVETLTREEFEKLFPTPVKKRSGTPALAGSNSR